MANVELTASVDASGLARAIPDIVATGRRTLAQQCVTSLAFIMRDAMELTPAASLSRINSDLDATLSPAVNKNGQLSRNKRKQESVVNLPDMSKADLIVMARMNPQSNFNKITGQRWMIPTPGGSSKSMIQGFARAYGAENAFAMFLRAVRPYAERMVKARRSSANFLKSGYKAAIRKLVEHPDYDGHGRSAVDKAQVNSLNTLTNDMGDAFVIKQGDAIQVTASNDVGEAAGKSNPTLALKHRQAAIDYSLPALWAAVDAEERSIRSKIEERLARGLERINKMLA